jgi:hypothetical protein
MPHFLGKGVYFGFIHWELLLRNIQKVGVLNREIKYLGGVDG